MIVLYILLALLALLVLVLLIPVRVHAAWTSADGLRVSAHVLFLRFALLPSKKEKPEKAPAKPEKKPPKEPEEKPGKKKKSTARMLSTVEKLYKASRWGLRLICRHTVFYRVRIYLSVGASDAHKTAESFGKINTAVFAALAALGTAFTLREPVVYIAPDFLRGSSRWDTSLRVRVVPMIALIACVNAFFTFIALNRSEKQKLQNKGGKKHEPATSGQ